MNNQAPSQKRSRVTLILLLMVFVIPILVAYIFHKNKSWLPQNTRNHGTIVSPVVALPEVSLKSTDGNEFLLKDFRGKWSYVFMAGEKCDEICQLTLVKTRNARIAQGGEAQRVNYYIIFKDHAASWANTEEFSKHHPKIRLLSADQKNLDIIQKAFGAGAVDTKTGGRVYLLDPAANYMMFYEADFDSLGIMEDLKHLLKASQIG